LEKLFEGAKKFTNSDFLEYKEIFKSIQNSQKPHTLFIGCSDSRIVPNLITNTMPGELFVIRNIANIVPVYREVNEFLATTSAIEYAVKILNIENIIVCGHSNCGGCNAFYLSDDELEKIPHTRKWIQLSKKVIDKVKSDQEIMNDLVKREWITEQLNIVEQISHLMTYPYIKTLADENKINIYGWHYVIQTGKIYNYNREKNIFELI